jgi:hypothetical protein
MPELAVTAHSPAPEVGRRQQLQLLDERLRFANKGLGQSRRMGQCLASAPLPENSVSCPFPFP